MKLMTSLLMLGLIVSVAGAAAGPGDFVVGISSPSAWYYVDAGNAYTADYGFGTLNAVAVQRDGDAWLSNTTGNIAVDKYRLPAGGWSQSGGWNLADAAVASDDSLYTAGKDGYIYRITDGYGYTTVSAGWGVMSKIGMQSNDSRVVVAYGGTQVWQETTALGYKSFSQSGIIDLAVLPNDDVLIATTAGDIWKIDSGFNTMTLDKSFAAGTITSIAALSDGSAVVGQTTGDITKYLGAGTTTVSGYGAIKDIIALPGNVFAVGSAKDSGHLWKLNSDLSVNYDFGTGWGDIADMYAVPFAVPEPATLVILGLGGLLLRKSKK